MLTGYWSFIQSISADSHHGLHWLPLAICMQFSQNRVAQPHADDMKRMRSAGLASKACEAGAVPSVQQTVRESVPRMHTTGALQSRRRRNEGMIRISDVSGGTLIGSRVVAR